MRETQTFRDEVQSPDDASVASGLSNRASLLESQVRAVGVFQELRVGRRMSVNRFESWGDCYFTTFTCYGGQLCRGSATS